MLPSDGNNDVSLQTEDWGDVLMLYFLSGWMDGCMYVTSRQSCLPRISHMLDQSLIGLLRSCSPYYKGVTDVCSHGHGHFWGSNMAGGWHTK